MKKLVYTVIALFSLFVLFFLGCERWNEFDFATKIIDVQDTITVGKPFKFRLVLRNDTLEEMKLAIDDSVQKSVSFSPQFVCNDEFMYSKPRTAKNDKKKVHNHQKYYLKKGDSLVYQLSGQITKVDNTLQMKIYGYDRVWKIKGMDCDSLTVYFAGKWIPRSYRFLDALDGYGFIKKVTIKSSDK
ncbi:hypothetical protein [Fibrella aquatica]|uniref:hypothetical protein n=1 Tax=Fibrella aquatica TaxID=3242487 RepID=UPI0035200E21